MVRLRRALAALIAALAFAAPPAAAQEPPPLLTVEGPGLAPAGLRLDRAALERIGLVELRTRTPWTDGERTFRGPLLADVLAAAKLSGRSVRAVALNDYFADIPAEVIAARRPVLALDLDGTPLSRRDKGPAWIVFDWSSDPALAAETFTRLSVWQVHRLVAR